MPSPSRLLVASMLRARGRARRLGGALALCAQGLHLIANLVKKKGHLSDTDVCATSPFQSIVRTGGPWRDRACPSSLGPYD